MPAPTSALTQSGPAPLLGPGDPPAVSVLNADGRAEVLLLCDHASRAVPATLDRLGLDEALLLRHIGWDIGAAEVVHRLTQLLDAPAIVSGFSRLVIDCNRKLEDVTSIPEESDGVVVPGNRRLSPAARAARVEACFRPYHRAIAEHLDRAERAGRHPAMISIHSFTPVMNGVIRPWHVGILWDKDPRLPVPLIARLGAADPKRIVGDNQPYSARHPTGYTIRNHAVPRGLPHVLIELRQDLIDTPAGAAAWADHIAEALAPILARPELYRAERF